MIRTSSLYEACQELFAGYPLAVRDLDRDGLLRLMVLMHQDHGQVSFFALLHDRSGSRARYSVHPWNSAEIADIESADLTDLPAEVVAAVTRGLPVPRHGSLFGWMCDGAVSALVVAYADYAPGSPEPGWAVLPLAGTGETRWPPFTGQRYLGHWFWEYCRAGSLACLDDLIAQTRGSVYWVDTNELLGSGCCVVTRDSNFPRQPELLSGRYVYYQILRAGTPVPDVQELLAGYRVTDLAARFR